MLQTLTLKNWRTHKETTLNFGKGTNVIVGVMGSGKSSIVNAISYSLFGTFPSLKNRSLSLSEIIMNKPNQENRAETQITFEQDGKKYRVERIIKMDGTNEAKVYEENRLIAGPKQKDANEKVEHILGLNYELFSRAVYAEQNELDFFLKLSPSERKKKFDELLELDKYENARKNSVSLQNELAKTNKQRLEFIQQQKETIKSHEEEKLRKQINEIEETTQHKEKENNTLKDTINNLEKTFSTLLEKEKKNQGLEELLTKTKERIKSLKEFLKKNEALDAEKIEKELTHIKEEAQVIEKKLLEEKKELASHIDKEKQHRTLEELLLKVNLRVETLKEDIAKGEKTTPEKISELIEKAKKEQEQLKNKITLNEKNIKETELILRKVGEELKVLEYEKKKLHLENGEISKLSGKCPTCRQELTETHKKHLEKEILGKTSEISKKEIEFEKEKKENEEKRKKEEKEIEDLKKELDEKNKEVYALEVQQKQSLEFEEKRKHLKNFLEEVPQVTKQITQTGFSKDALEKIREKLGETEKKLSTAKNDIILKEKELINAKEKKTKEEELSREEGTLLKTEKEIKENNFDKKELDATREDIYKKKSQLSVNESEIKSKLELKKSILIIIEKIEQIKKNIIEIETEALKIDEATKKLGVFANCLTATQIELREQMLQTINQAMSNIWQQIYPYKDFIDARLLVTEDGYDLQVLSRANGWVRVEGVLSGGERSAAALCIRIAFALVLTKKLSMLILDEPTHNLDSNAVAKLSEMLREELPKLVEQVFVITHDKQLEMAASSNLYLLTRNKDLDESTKTESINAY
jgi:exonuclease SbcC